MNHQLTVARSFMAFHKTFFSCTVSVHQASTPQTLSATLGCATDKEFSTKGASLLSFKEIDSTKAPITLAITRLYLSGREVL